MTSNSAIEHISSLIADMNTHQSDPAAHVSDTQRVANSVANKVHAGSESVNENEGILVQDPAPELYPASKQASDRNGSRCWKGISEFVKEVVTKSELVAYNAYLVSDQVEGNTELSRAILRAVKRSRTSAPSRKL